jgi:DNA-binding NarL/FixJ family response regulator
MSVDPEHFRPAPVSDLASIRLARERLRSLNASERLVLDRLRRGQSNRTIAAELSVPVSTITSRVARIYLKLGVPRGPGVHQRVCALLIALGHEPPPG